jgi:hypothetical protein
VLKGTGQNLLLQSNTFTNVVWIKNTTTLTGSQSDPFGGTTATKIDATSSDSFLYQPYTVAVGVTYTFSVYLRADTNTTLLIRLYDSSSGASTDLSVTATTTWQRFSVTRTVASGTTEWAIIGAVNSFSTGETIYAYGAQTELGSVLNTYIPTTTTAVYGTPTLSFSGVSTIGLQSDGSLYVQPAGTGALQAQATTSSATGGNARGANAVDWQTLRSAASQVASSAQTVISGGAYNTVTGGYGSIVGGTGNLVSGFASFVGSGSAVQSTGALSVAVGGDSNTAQGSNSAVVGGKSNSSAGYLNFIGGGFTNSGTSNSAVTTQSGTMNGTTAVTLSGSNASIKVGQYITGTSISADTYVAAISGTSLTLSKVASGSSTSTLSFFTPHGVVVGGGNNQATGSYSFIGGGGDAGSSANRNVASGDWSTVGGGIKNTATGIGAVISGGGYDGTVYGNIASGSASVITGGIGHTVSAGYATVLGGAFNLANGQFSTVMGASGSTRSIVGNIVTSAQFGAVSFSTGTAQSATLILGKQTTNATPTVLTSEGSAAATNNQVILPNNSAYFFTGEVVAGVTGGGNTKGWTIEGVIKRGSGVGTTALVGSTVTSMYADVGAATWTIALSADTTNGGLAVTFTGQAATTIRTVAQIRTTEMTY